MLNPFTYYGLTSQQTIPIKPLEAQIAHDEEVEQSIVGPQKRNYGGAAIMGLCSKLSGTGCSGVFGLGDWAFNQCAVTGSC